MSLNCNNSANLEKSFEQYRQTEEYKQQLENRLKVLKVFGIEDQFAGKLADDSIQTGILIGELIDAEDEIKEENSRLVSEFSEINKQKSEGIIDITNAASNSRTYGGVGNKAA